MPELLCHGATLMCSFGTKPSSLIVLPAGRPFLPTPAANILDHQPIVNIPPFGMCTTPTNPAVAAATSAALGVLTPAPCVPNTQTPWTTGSPTVLIGNMPPLNNTSTCMCSWGGVITITNPGQTTVQIS